MTTDAEPRRLLNHVELVYRPGERKLAGQVFELLGFAVVDDVSEFIVASADPAVPDFVDNTCYGSEVTPEQWQFEQRLAESLRSGDKLGESYDTYQGLLSRAPQRALHFGVHCSTLADLEATVERVRNVAQTAPELEGRIKVTGTYYPGDPGSLADNIVQAFFYTDVVVSGIITLGQHIELHWYSDQPPALPKASPRTSFQAS